MAYLKLKKPGKERETMRQPLTGLAFRRQKSGKIIQQNFLKGHYLSHRFELNTSGLFLRLKKFIFSK